MTTKFEDPNDAPKADRVTGYKCEACEHLHIVLVDEDGLALATAVVSREMLEQMLTMIDGPAIVAVVVQ